MALGIISIGYGYVVTNVEPAVVAGCPAKVIGHKRENDRLSRFFFKIFLVKNG